VGREPFVWMGFPFNVIFAMVTSALYIFGLPPKIRMVTHCGKSEKLD
jgi:hypothetical protein